MAVRYSGWSKIADPFVQFAARELSDGIYRISSSLDALETKVSTLDGTSTTVKETTVVQTSVAGGTGTVSSVALTMPSTFSVAGSPITTTGTLAVTFATQTANTHLSGPASGGAATPTWRAHVLADLPIGTANQILGTNSGATAQEHKTLSGTTNQVTVTHGAGSITFSAPQNIHSGASPTFAGLTLSGLSASRLVATNGSSALASVADLSSWVAGTSNRITVANDGDGTITLSAPQDLHTSASPTFSAPSFSTSVTVGSGTAITKIVVYSQSLTPASVSASTSAEQTFTVTGLTTADKVIVNGPSPTAGTGIVNARVSAADTLALTFMNATAGSLTPTSGTYTVVAVRS